MSKFFGAINPWAVLCGENIWRASLQGAIAIAAAWAISRWCRFLSARVTCWIWRLACLKLLFALLFVQPLNIPLLAAKPAEVVSVDAAPLVARASRAVLPEASGQGTPPIELRLEMTQSQNLSGLTWYTLLVVLWAAGVFCSILRTGSQWRAIVRLRHDAQPARSTSLLRELRQEAIRLGIRRLPQLRVCRQTDSVQLAGIWRPVIILPESVEETFDEEERRLILAHELAHLKRLDLAWNWLPTVTGWLFFFHPLVWILVRRWCESQEAACDELVIQHHGARRVQYGRLLFKISTRWPDKPRSALIAAGMSGAYRHLEWRILAMTRVKPQSPRQFVIAVAAVPLIVVVGLIPWRLVAQEPARPHPPATPVLAGDAPHVAPTHVLVSSATTTSYSGTSSTDGTSGTSSSSGSTAVILPGKIYMKAGLDVKSKTGATEKFMGIIAIDPNTGAWERRGIDGFSIRVSPQKDRLAFCEFAKSPGPTNIHLADSNGQNSVKLLDNASLPIWSPEGKRLLYTRATMPVDTPRSAPRNHETSILDLVDKRTKKLPIPASDEVDDWSRDGEWLVTVSDRHPPFGHGYQLYVMHPDGSHERRITQGDGLNCYPRFRPGTNQVVYNHQGHGLDSLWIVDLDGANPKQLLASDKNGVGAPNGAYWSPDGQWLAVLRFDWQTDVPGVSNPTKEKFRMSGYCKDRIEIIAPDGSSRGILDLAGVRHIDWIELGDWR